MAKLRHIYEIQQIRIDGTRYPRRRIHLFSVGCFDTLDHAEEAMRTYIVDEKERSAEWGEVKDYYDKCLGYYISERKIHKRLPEFGDNVVHWLSYTADGEMNDRSMVGWDEPFHGRETKDIHFQIGDIVEEVAYDKAELVIVAGQPPSVEWVRQREEYCKEHFPGRPFQLDDTDDCYLVYPVDGEEWSHDHVPCYNLFRPTRKVPKTIAEKLRARLKITEDNDTFQNH